MPEERPDPDALLAKIHAEEARRKRARLKVFLGMCAGVGKTYTMLEAARVRAIEGVEVVIGIVETHKRSETEYLVLGLDLLPRREVDYRGIVVREFDLDACLERKPQLVLLDELAHTNAPGSRHEKRWQDVQELLAAGISVYTTLNIQHIESLSDLVAQITGVIVRETVPDSIVDGADEIELVDLPPEELLKRLSEGKVYLSEQARLAAGNFFRLGNLIALRELALRYVAERVDAQVQQYRREEAITRTWPVRERLLVCVSASPQSARLVRSTRRLATRLQAEWLAVHIETPRPRLSDKDRDRLHRILRLAEQLGAEASTIVGSHFADDLVAFARARNVTKIVIGKSFQPRWRERLFGSLIQSVARKASEIDLYVISGEGEQAEGRGGLPVAGWRSWPSVLIAALAVGACTALSSVIFPRIDRANIVMLYLVSVVLVAFFASRTAALLASILSVAAFDFFFVPPYFTFAVTDFQYLVTFAVLLAVALLISNLTARIREQERAARRREAQSTALYELTRALADAGDEPSLLTGAVKQTQQTFDVRARIFTRLADGKLSVAAGARPGDVDDRSLAVAQWTFDNRQEAGLGTNTLPSAAALHVPIDSSREVVGVLTVEPNGPNRFLDPDERRMLEVFARQIGLAMERVRLGEDAHRAHLQMETERLRSALLSSVSHDFRTPLAVILGASSSLLDERTEQDRARRLELVQSIHAEAERLDHLVANLLNMTKLETGAVRVQKSWHPLEEIVGSALNQMRRHMGRRQVTVQLPADLPLVPMDGALIEQALINLLDNAIKYTPDEAPIEISASASGDQVVVAIADRGQGLPPGDLERVFEKFYRGSRAAGGGVGLGLSICEAIVQAHGGRIWAENRGGGGAVFSFSLPIGEEPPRIAPEREG